MSRDADELAEKLREKFLLKSGHKSGDTILVFIDKGRPSAAALNHCDANVDHRGKRYGQREKGTDLFSGFNPVFSLISSIPAGVLPLLKRGRK